MSTPLPTLDVLVLQHTIEDHPGYLGQWLDAQGANWQVLCAEAGHAYPCFCTNDEVEARRKASGSKVMGYDGAVQSYVDYLYELAG